MKLKITTALLAISWSASLGLLCAQSPTPSAENKMKTPEPKLVWGNTPPYQAVMELRGLVTNDKGGHERPETAQQVEITLYTNDGSAWTAKWERKQPALQPRP